MERKFQNVTAREVAVLLHGLARLVDDHHLQQEAAELTDQLHAEQTERYRYLLQNMKAI